MIWSHLGNMSTCCLFTFTFSPVFSIFFYIPVLLGFILYSCNLGFPGGSDGKECACNVGDLGSIPGLGRSPEKGKSTHSTIIAWRILWTEEPGRPMGLQRVTRLSDFNFCLFSSSFSIFLYFKKWFLYLYVPNEQYKNMNTVWVSGV